MEENPGMAHKIVLNNRNQGNLTGILDVISFDENSIVLDTDMGLLTIKGKDLHVNRLSLEKGELDIEGRTDSLVYSAGGGASGAWRSCQLAVPWPSAMPPLQPPS